MVDKKSQFREKIINLIEENSDDESKKSMYTRERERIKLKVKHEK